MTPEPVRTPESWDTLLERNREVSSSLWMEMEAQQRRADARARRVALVCFAVGFAAVSALFWHLGAWQ